MDFDKRTVIAIILVTIIILLTPLYQKLIFKNSQNYQVINNASIDTLKQAKSNASSDLSIKSNQDSISNEKSEVVDTKKVVDSVSSSTEEVVSQDTTFEISYDTLENEYYLLVFSSKGGVLRKAYLKEYKSYIQSDTFSIVQLIPEDYNGFLNNKLYYGKRVLDLSKYNFNFYKSGNKLYAEARVLFDSDTVVVKKVFSIGDKKYTLNYEYNILSKEIIDNNIVELDGGINVTERNIKDDLGYFKAYARMGDDVIEEDLAKKEEINTIEKTGASHWIALKSKYFLGSIICDKNSDGIILKGKKIKEKDSKFDKKYYNAALKFKNKYSLSNKLLVYLGPIDYLHLKSFGIGLEKTVNLGGMLIKPFSIMTTYMLIFFSKFIANYGLVIILFSLVIKLLTFPFTHKSYESTKKMSELQPQLEALKEKYKNNPQQLNKATMDLYKKAGVNPLGGCLPLLFQMPIFFGLYRVFASTIMLRNESFLWINNLADKDPTLILPIIMAVMSLVQSLMTIKDPKQKMTAYIMPIFLFFIFKGLAAGLVLYWTCFNVFTIVQQELVNKFYKGKAVSNSK